jgi:hypothetical protein
MSRAKPSCELTASDWEKHPVWSFDLANETLPGRDETWMIPVRDLPVVSLDNCGCLANVTLAYGRNLMATLWSIDLRDATATKQFIQISLWLDGRWWPLSERLFPTERGTIETHLPADLASKLGLALDAVFPIAYDISEFAHGPAEIIRGTISAEPRAKLTKDQRLALLRSRAARR